MLNIIGPSATLVAKKPRVVRGSERLTTRLSKLGGLTLAAQQGVLL
jgi:hypothetical protein